MWYIINVSSYSSSATSFSSSIFVINKVVLRLYLLYIPCIKVALTTTLPPLSYHLHQPYWLAPSYWDFSPPALFHCISPVLGLPAFFLILDAWSLDRQVVPICRWGITSTRCKISQKYTFLKNNIVWLCLETQKFITVYSAINILVVIIWNITPYILVRRYRCYGRLDLIFTRTEDYVMSLPKGPSGMMMMAL